MGAHSSTAHRPPMSTAARGLRTVAVATSVVASGVLGAGTALAHESHDGSDGSWSGSWEHAAVDGSTSSGVTSSWSSSTDPAVCDVVADLDLGDALPSGLAEKCGVTGTGSGSYEKASHESASHESASHESVSHESVSHESASHESASHGSPAPAAPAPAPAPAPASPAPAPTTQPITGPPANSSDLGPVPGPGETQSVPIT